MQLIWEILEMEMENRLPRWWLVALSARDIRPAV
jgi:hypothetical protein